MSAKHRQEKGPHSDFVKFQKGECGNMKVLSVLFTLALFASANSLAAHLRRVHALPARATTTHSIPHTTGHNHETPEKI